MREPTPEEQIIVQQGLDAEALLAHPAFQHVCQSLMGECFAQFAESKPNDQTGREENYNFFRGLRAIEMELRGRVHAKTNLTAMLDAANASADD